MMSKKTVTIMAGMSGQSEPPPVPKAGQSWKFERVDFTPTRNGEGRVIWHTYVLEDEPSAPVVVRARVKYTPDSKFPLDLDSKIGQDVAILKVDHNNTAFCLPMAGGPNFAIAFTRLEIAPGTDVADVHALFERRNG